MIFVTIGTNEAPFDRLLEAVAALSTSEEIVVQHGSSAIVPANASRDVRLPALRRPGAGRCATSRVVVTHAGIGSIMTALSCGKRPVVVPRLRRLRRGGGRPPASGGATARGCGTRHARRGSLASSRRRWSDAGRAGGRLARRRRAARVRAPGVCPRADLAAPVARATRGSRGRGAAPRRTPRPRRHSSRQRRR